MKPTQNPFERFRLLGYQRLVPIIPPGATISERSTLYKRVGTKQDGRGKTPGIKGQDGVWFSFDWVPYEADDTDLTRWSNMGAGVGIKTGQGLVAIDADTLNTEHAKIIRDIIDAQLGRLPVRVGNHPKALYLCRVDGPFQYARVEFGERDEKNRLLDRVEVLSDGRQFVAHGIHPKTKKPYEWPRELIHYDELPIFKPEQITQLLEALRPLLPAASEVVREGATTDINQNALKGPLEAIRSAVHAIPNTSALFPSRESYRDMGYAIKAALPDDEGEAYDIFMDWCQRWDDGTNDPDVVEADWRRMKPPYRRGASWLYELAEEHGKGKFSPADVWFDEIDTSENPFAEIELNAQKSPDDEPAPIKWIDPREWQGLEPPTREWEVEGWIPKGEVTLLYGDGGIGKTLLIHQYATAAAAGVDWLGQKTRQARVMCFFCEDSEDELMRRQLDINKAMMLDFDDYSERLRIASRKYMDNLFILWDRNTGAMKRQSVWARLLADARAFKADVIVVDTIADTYGGSEIDRGQVNAFVKSCLGRLAQEIGGSVIALGHPSMSGKQSGSGTSGSTAWSNASRSRLFLRYPKGVEKGNVRELEGMKLNYGPKGALLKLRWERGAFGLLASSLPGNPEIELNALKGDLDFDGGWGEVSAAVLGLPAGSIEGAAVDAVLAALRASRGVQMSLAPNSPYWAGKVLKRREGDLLEAISDAEVETALRRLEKAGAIYAEEAGRKANRHVVYGLAVRDNLSATSLAGGVFD